MWTFNYAVSVLLALLLVLILYFMYKYSDLKTESVNRLNYETKEYNKIVTEKDSLNDTIEGLRDKIEQTTSTNGISPEYRNIIDSLEAQSIKDKELLASYETEVTNYETKLTNYKELVETLKSDIVFKKAKRLKHWDSRPVVHRVKKPDIDIQISLKDIPRQVLIRVIYYIECSNLSLKVVSFKKLVETLGYTVNPVNCRIVGRMLRDMYFKVGSSRDGMVLLLHNDRNRKKLDKFYKKYCPDEK